METAVEYPEHIANGLKTLKERVPNHNPKAWHKFTGQKVMPEITAAAEEGRSTPFATEEYTRYIEDIVRSACSPYEAYVDEMSYDELEAFSWLKLMCCDVERGLGMGQIPHLDFNHSLDFILWERKLWRRVEARYQKFEPTYFNHDKMILPFERSYWVIPGRLLAGEIPSSREADIRKRKVRNLVKMGFDAIINLMEPGEKTFSGEVLADYYPELEAFTKITRRKVVVHRKPIPDLSVTTPQQMKEILELIHQMVEDGKRVYVHCWGGVGRTGTVVGCYLLEYNMANTDNVIEIINYLKRTTPIHERRSPETDEQIDFVLDWPVLRTTQ